VGAWAQRYESFIELHFSYNPAALAALRNCTPATARTWDPDDKLWSVSEPYVDRVLRALQPHVGPIETADLRRPNLKPGVPGKANWAHALYDALPDHLKQPAFRALTKVLHPDIGGDLKLAQQLNDAFANRRAS
jgi:hypothetical protein